MSNQLRNPQDTPEDNRQNSPEAQPEKAKGTVSVSYGVHRLTSLKLEGKAVGEVRRQLATALNIPEEAETLVNGKNVPGSYVLQENDTVEFVKLTGQKG